MKYFSELIVYIIKLLQILDNKISQLTVHNPNHYEDLAPIDNADDTTYNEALKWALGNTKITNIALTAPYGAGKSSILRTFEKHNKDHKYLNISLATFDENEKSDNHSIEKSILQQMFYKVKTKAIPYSRFKRIINTKFLFLKSVFIFLWLLSTFILFKSEMIKEILYLPDGLYIWSFLLFVVGSFIIIYKIFEKFSNIKLHKINLQNPEIEIDNGSEVSILNKHLDEILYFFEVTQFDVVIIEDLDRFENPDIFTKLRELNALINNSEQINKRIVFIYAIRDNMFQDENRTKFFDFMIPVIPFINSSNSIEILQKKIEDTGLKEKLSEEFITDIALYISDMRMLKNIYNEFMLYKSKLSKLDIDLNKLFAMIIYKNIYPSDFSDLHDDKGMVFNVFITKNQIIEKLVLEIDNDLKKLKDNLQVLEEQFINNIAELRAIYIQAILDRIPNANQLYMNSREYTFIQAKEDSIFKLLQQQQNIQYYQQNYVCVNSSISFKVIENSVNADISYNAREELIHDIENGKLEKLKQEIGTKSKRKQSIKSYSIKELIDSFNPEEILDEKLRENKLLVYLIRNGYIDEMYHSFISYFFEGSMTKEDMDFVLSIKNQEALGFEYKLAKVEKLLKKIRINEFYQEGILNYNLVDYLYEHKGLYQEQIEVLILQLANEKDKSIQFIDGYIEYGKFVNEFIKDITHKWLGLWSYISKKSLYSIDKKDIYLALIIQHVSIDDIVAMDKELSLSTYISKKSNFLSLIAEDGNASKIKQILTKLKIKFEDINNFTYSNDICQYIYDNNLYQINNIMINLICGQENFESLEISNYTTILRTDKKALQVYIENNISEYIENVFLKLDTNSDEDEKTIIELLNNEKISDEKKKEIIIKENIQIQMIAKIPEPLWNTLFEYNKIQAIWENILYFHQNKDGLDKSLIQFLNIEQNYLELSKSRIKSNDMFDEEFIIHLVKSICLASEITEESFEYLLKSVPYKLDSLTFENLSKDKINIIIESDILDLTNDNYNLLKEKFPSNHIHLIEYNIDEFPEHQKDYQVDENDFKLLFDSEKISINEKISIINTMDVEAITNQLANKIMMLFLSNNTSQMLSIEVIKVIYQYKIPIESKINILNKYVKNINKDELLILLTLLGKPYSEIAEHGKQPKIRDNEYNRQLVIQLKDIDYISSFKEVGSKLQIYTKRTQG